MQAIWYKNLVNIKLYGCRLIEMTTHGDGKSNSRLQLVLPDELYKRVSKLAGESDVKVAHYIRRILTEAAENEVIYPPSSGVFEEPAN